MIPVKVDQLLLSNMGFVVLLKGLEDQRSLPIFIGAAEAQSIAIQINKVKVPRPLTHDLLKNILDCLECRLKRIAVTDLVEGTFFAKLIFERDGSDWEVDSRPSDAIALALRFSAPIFVAEKVMEEAGRLLDKADVAAAAAQATPGAEAKPKKPPRRLTPKEILKRDLDKAIKEERYEDAARLRDELKKLDDASTKN
jgi:bifunctional DNase/RNase